MKQSLRAKRMERHHARMKKKSDLNLTSLMDIFTVLVFFLMINSSEAQLLKDTKEIKMPKSIAKEMPKDTLVVQVSNDQIIVQGQLVADVAVVKTSEEDVIPGLDKELTYQASRRPELSEKEKILGRPVVIQGHHEVPYVVLKKILATCAGADFRDISLAVTRILEKSADKKEG